MIMNSDSDNSMTDILIYGDGATDNDYEEISSTGSNERDTSRGSCCNSTVIGIAVLILVILAFIFLVFYEIL